MLNLEENLCYHDPYDIQKDWIFRGLGYVMVCGILLDFLRNQIPEVNLLQLIPGVLFFLLLLTFFLTIFLSSFIFFIPLKNDIRRDCGVKNVGKILLVLALRIAILFFFFIWAFNYNVVIPISLDYFDSSGEKDLEQLWSFDQVLSFQTIFLNLLTFFSQLPVIGQFYFLTEKDFNLFPKYWKEIVFFFIFISGLLTPTMDGSTQLAFFSSIFILYLSFLTFLKKRANFKNQGTIFFGS